MGIHVPLDLKRKKKKKIATYFWVRAAVIPSLFDGTYTIRAAIVFNTLESETSKLLLKILIRVTTVILKVVK